MPELPEVETVKNILKPLLIGKTINDIKVLKENIIEGDVDFFINSLKTKTIQDISRKGKFLIFMFTDGTILLSHLRMEGKYIFTHKDKSNYARVQFYLDDNTILNYDDSRGFGTMQIRSKRDYLLVPPLSKLGPEANENIDFEYLKNVIKSRNLPIKSLLLDQSIMSGLGNIYVDECLFFSKVHPLTPGKLLTDDEIKKIIHYSKVVLDKAINLGGSTIKSYHPAEGIDGKFQNSLVAYGKSGQNCVNCSTPLIKIKVSGRGTTYCYNCQIKKSLKPFVLGVTGPVGAGKSSIINVLKNNSYKSLSGDLMIKEMYEELEIIQYIKDKICSDCVINNTIDKSILGKFLIKNKSNRIKLTNYLYPLIKKRISKHISSLSLDEKIVLEIPMLFESKINSLCDKVLFVDIDKDIQLERLKLRSSNYLILLEINKDFNYFDNKEKSDIVIKNNGNIKDLEEKIMNLINTRII